MSAWHLLQLYFNPTNPRLVFSGHSQNWRCALWRCFLLRCPSDRPLCASPTTSCYREPRMKTKCNRSELNLWWLREMSQVLKLWDFDIATSHKQGLFSSIIIKVTKSIWKQLLITIYSITHAHVHRKLTDFHYGLFWSSGKSKVMTGLLFALASINYISTKYCIGGYSCGLFEIYQVTVHSWPCVCFLQESSPLSLYFPRESLKLHSRTESSSKAAFLDHSETLWMRSAAAW